MILRALVAAIAKDIRLLLRDPVGLVFLTIAPLLVMSVAGFSLSTMYGSAPDGNSAYILPVVDQDGGAITKALQDRLARDGAIEVRPVASRDAGVALIRSRDAAAVLVIPEGTELAVANGRPGTLTLLTDPVKFVELAQMRAVIQELRHAVGQEALDRARRRLLRTRAKLEAGRARLERRLARLRREVEDASRQARELRADAARRVEAERARLERSIRQQIATLRDDETGAARTRLAAEIAPLRTYLDSLVQYRSAFESWLAQARAAAGSYADRIPPPPEPPRLPPEVDELAHGDPATLAARVIPSNNGDIPTDVLRHFDVRLPAFPELPAIAAPQLPALPEIRLPRLLDIEEESVSGASDKLNSFDQYVPGFSITFLMLGMLLGVAVTLFDERELGTLDRVRATQAPVATLVLGKLAVRFLVGVFQMILLLAVGRFAFGVSLGPEPAALLLPTAGIVFVGTAFGVLAAGIAPTRDAVMPLGAIAIVTMCAIGGCWWPIDLEPHWMREVARAFPTTWAMEAFKDLMMRRQGAATAVYPTLVMFAFGCAFIVLGLGLFARRSD